MSRRNFNRVVVVGVDGSGKSTAAHGAAIALSEQNRSSDIRVADSDGVTSYRSGEVVSERARFVEGLIAPAGASRLGSAAMSLAFMGARQYSEQLLAHGPNRLVIGVRDPFRVDPATYAPILLSPKFESVSPEKRLKMFGLLTIAAHPKMITSLVVDETVALEKAFTRGGADFHETPESVELVARELPRVLDAYSRAKGVLLTEVEALQPNTSDDLAATFERYVIL